MTIAQIFTALNLSNLSEIAALYGVSTRTVRRWLDGSREPGPIFYRYSEALLSGWRPSRLPKNQSEAANLPTTPHAKGWISTAEWFADDHEDIT